MLCSPVLSYINQTVRPIWTKFGVEYPGGGRGRGIFFKVAPEAGHAPELLQHLLAAG